MKLFPRSLLAMSVAFITQQAWSSEAFINVFYENSPMQGLEVKIDGESVGTTDMRGNAEASTDQGRHTLELVRDGKVVGKVVFDVGSDQDAEISVTYSDYSDTPKVKVSKFKSDDNSAVGFIGGVITDVDGDPIAGAWVEAGTKAAQTDANGVYEIEAPRGIYTLDITHPDYESAKVNDVRVFAGLGAAASVKLTAAETTLSSDGSVPSPLEEVVILGTYKPLDTASTLERFSSNVIDALDLEQMTRFGDGNIAIALTRLVGVTVTAGKYANVRGLDGRYISSTLNDFMMPSTNPIKRDVQLDLFPSSILDGVEVQKSYSADLPGSTTAGVLRIKTKGLPDGQVFKASTNVGAVSGVTGDEIVSYRGSNTDRWGYDSGLREVPQSVVDQTNNGLNLRFCNQGAGGSSDCVTPMEGAALAVTFQDDWNVKNREANPAAGGSMAYGNLVDVSELTFGYYGAVSYSSSTKDRIDAVISDKFEEEGDYRKSTESFSLDSYFVTGIEFDSGEVLSKTVVLRDSDRATRFEEVVDVEDNRIKNYTLEWTEREFASQQFLGEHNFNVGSEEHMVDWRVGYSNTKWYQPDRRTYGYRNSNLNWTSIERRWSDLDENSIDVGVNYSAPVQFSDDVRTEFKAGVLASDKSRDMEMFRYGLQHQGVGAADLDAKDTSSMEDIASYQNFVLDRLRLETQTFKTDSYGADEATTAIYINSVTEVGDGWNVVAGVRQEEFSQELSYPNSPESNNELDNTELLPAITLTHFLGESWQIRAGLSKTISYPGLVERSLSRFYDPETDEEYIGNPDLEIATIDNVDLRFEFYLTDEESFSVALFNKEMTKPIERVRVQGSGSATDNFTFRNADSATLVGIELDGNLNVFETASYLGFVSGNIALIDSEVELDRVSLVVEGEDDQGRELQGQSPVLANLQFGLDHFAWDQKFTLLVNFFDDRIYAATSGPTKTPRYELGRVLVNFNYEKMFGDSFTFKAQLKNLLDADVEYEQNDAIYETYKEGVSGNLSLSYEF